MAPVKTQAPAETIDLVAKLPTVATLLRKGTERLDKQARRCFTSLARFAATNATFDLGALRTVRRGADTKAVARQLVSRGLLEPVGGRMFPNAFDVDATRENITDQVSMSEEQEAFLSHAAYHESVLCRADELYERGDEGTRVGLDLFDLEWMNIQAGQSWAAANAETSHEAAKLCCSYPSAGTYILALRLTAQENISWRRAGLAAAERLNNLKAKGVHLNHLGLMYARLGDIHKSIHNFEEALQVFRSIGDRMLESGVLGNLGFVHIELGDFRRAVELLEENLELARSLGARRGEGVTLGNLGIAYDQLGDYRRAIEYYLQDLAIARELGDPHSEGQSLGNLGIAHKNLGEYSKAIEFYQERLLIARRIGDVRGEDRALSGLGVVHNELDEPERAIEYLEQALILDRSLGDRLGEGRTLGNLGIAYHKLGDYARAIECHQQDLSIAVEAGDLDGEGQALGNLGEAHAAQGNMRLAMEHYERALAISRRTGHRHEEGTQLWNRSLALDRLGERAAAIADAQAALEIFKATESPSAVKVREKFTEWGVLGSPEC